MECNNSLTTFKLIIITLLKVSLLILYLTIYYYIGKGLHSVAKLICQQNFIANLAKKKFKGKQQINSKKNNLTKLKDYKLQQKFASNLGSSFSKKSRKLHLKSKTIQLFSLNIAMNSFAMFLSSLCSHDLTTRLSLDMYRDCNNIHAHIITN